MWGEGEPREVTIDASRYALLTQEYRYAEVKLPGIASLYAKAKDLTLESKFRNISPTLATAIANLIGAPRRRLEVVVSYTDFGIDIFAGQTPTALIVAPKLDINGLFILTRAVFNEDQNMTTFEAWGG